VVGVTTRAEVAVTAIAAASIFRDVLSPRAIIDFLLDWEINLSRALVVRACMKHQPDDFLMTIIARW
jgi:hypothetical protein